MKAFSLLDLATQAYSAPFFQPTPQAALRIAKTEANNKQSMIGQHPQDYELYIVGDFNEQTGELTGQRERIARLSDLVDNK